ncbi:MAG: lysine exporter LysO family protein, partial [Alistipes sp.]|nr:lysine exporter LysO family protein [Alistipes sp.]
MFVIFAVILGGIVTGRLLSSRRLAFVSRFITVIIWALLFLLGLEVGSDPAVVGGMATLGRTAFVIFVFSVAGSIGASWLLWRRIRGRSASGTEGAAANPASAGSVAGRGFGAGGGGCGANGFSGSVAD